jgi:hypothetical protein
LSGREAPAFLLQGSSQMTAFGFSAFLKLIHLNERPKRTELRKRLRGQPGRGYDYHRSLRILSKRLMVEKVSLAEVLIDAEDIKKPAERSSAKSGVKMLDEWRKLGVADAAAAEQITVESPSGRYRVNYRPDFRANIAGVTTLVHVWNTMRPDLDSRLVCAALAPFLDDAQEQGVQALAVLSLRDGELYTLRAKEPHMALATLVFASIERLIEQLGDEDRRPPAEDRPSV